MISVIIPYIEDRGFLNEALESLHRQSYQNFEIVFAQGDYLQGVNINRGLKRARGEYIKILHDDDTLPPNSLRDLRQGIGNFDWCCGDMETFGTPEYCDAQAYTGRIPVLSMMINKNQVYGGTTLYKKSVLINVEVGGYNEKLWTGEEYELHLRLLRDGYSVTYIPKIVHRYRLHQANKSYNLTYGKKMERAEYIKDIAKKYDKRYNTL